MNPLAGKLVRFWKPALGLIVLGYLVVWSGGFLATKTGSQPVPHAAGRPLPWGAQLVEVERAAVAPLTEVVGSTESAHEVQVTARLSAHVIEVLAQAGDRVRAGQPLARLDDRELAEQAAAAEARFRQVEAEHRRVTQLFERGAATEQARQASEAAFQAAQAGRQQARVQLAYAQVEAPLEGVMTERRVEVGELAQPGRVLFGLYDARDMRLVAAVPLRLAERLAPGQRIEVELDYPARTLAARVAEIVSEVDPRTRTRKVKLRFEEQPGDVLPGAFGRFQVEEAPREALLVPAAAVRRIGQLEQVEVEEGGRLKVRLVKTGAPRGDRLEILSGLRAGEKVLAAVGEE